MAKELYRSKEHRIIAGVCGGIAEYFETDPSLVRLIFIFATILGGGSILVYLLLWVFIPERGGGRSLTEEIREFKNEFKDKFMEEQKDHEHHHHDHYHHKGSEFFGFGLIIVGILFLADNFYPGYGLRMFWPVILIFFGLAIMLGKHHEDHHSDK